MDEWMNYSDSTTKYALLDRVFYVVVFSSDSVEPSSQVVFLLGRLFEPQLQTPRTSSARTCWK